MLLFVLAEKIVFHCFIYVVTLFNVFYAFLSGLHRRSVDAGGAEHGSGWRTRAGDSTNSSIHLRFEWDLPGSGRNGGGAGIPDTRF